jgi:predicted aconitase
MEVYNITNQQITQSVNTIVFDTEGIVQSLIDDGWTIGNVIEESGYLQMTDNCSIKSKVFQNYVSLVTLKFENLNNEIRTISVTDGYNRLLSSIVF